MSIEEYPRFLEVPDDSGEDEAIKKSLELNQEIPQTQEANQVQKLEDKVVLPDSLQMGNKDNPNNFMVPEGWVEDITEAEKEAYRIKVFASIVAPEDKTAYVGVKDFFSGVKKNPTTNDYEAAKELHKEFFEDRLRRSEDKGIDHVVSKIADITAGNIIRAYVELRARMLAKQERKAFEDNNK